jgi:hypothetical protein
MARPRVFVSSTYYDLRHIRASLETFIESLGYEPILSEKGDIAYAPNIPLDESCYREAAGSDVLVLIIGGRYGAERSDSWTALPHGFFDRYDSITKLEYKNAAENNVPVYILVDALVYAEYQTFQKNKNNKDITYAHVDSVNVFHLIEEILLKRRNNALNTFSRYAEIEDWLREQWAGLFRDFLKRTSESEQIASLADQVTQLSELNKTLKTYLENLMPSIISPEKSKGLIEAESQRLDEIGKKAKFSDSPLFYELTHFGEFPEDKAIAAIRDAKDLKEFFRLVEEYSSISHASKISQRLEALDLAQRELNELRTILERAPFEFDSQRSWILDATSRAERST